MDRLLRLWVKISKGYGAVVNSKDTNSEKVQWLLFNKSYNPSYCKNLKKAVVLC